MSRANRQTAGVSALALILALSLPRSAHAAPPSEAPATEPSVVTVSGRVREAGSSRAPVSGAVVMLVAAEPDARVGKPARVPLDPNTVTWMLRAETDAEGRFTIAEVPPGKLRVIVVAGGYARLELYVEAWAEGQSELELHIEPELDGQYRTEVAVERPRLDPPEHVLDAQQARHYAGGGDDPLLVALNLPGVARSPGGLGLLSLRGGNPTETGVYLDGHPVPRAFHVVPIASILSPPMLDRVELRPGSYGPNYGSFSGGMVMVTSRSGRRDGIHGQAHLDLFDVGLTTEAPIGPGSMHFGLRRSHIDAVVQGAERVIGPTGILLPSYWDYLGRFDMPIRGGHSLTVRALGAGDRLRGRGTGPVPGQSPNLFEYSAAFHRFDLDYRHTRGPVRVLISPSLRLDSAKIGSDAQIRRDANVLSGRMEFESDLRPWLTLHIGSDVVHERWRRRERIVQQLGGDIFDPDQLGVDEAYEGQQTRAGMWLAAAFRLRGWSLVPSLRLNVFDVAGRLLTGVDPRLEIDGQVHPKIRWSAKVGRYSIPLVFTNIGSRSGLIHSDSLALGGVLDVPPYLIRYFDPSIDGEVRDGSAATTSAIQASTGVEAELPWSLRGRATVFWREVLPSSVWVYFEQESFEIHAPRRRAYGLELLLRREFGRVVDGWLGYTLMQARVRPHEQAWGPAEFDQRHNLVLLLSFALPRQFRFGARFRLVSGNPLATVLGGERVVTRFGVYYQPIRAALGNSYQPLFHQLDLRIDKRWLLRRTTVSAYLDVQNVYNRWYPEVSVYSSDWSQRASLIGLPIYPSLGVQVDY